MTIDHNVEFTLGFNGESGGTPHRSWTQQLREAVEQGERERAERQARLLAAERLAAEERKARKATLILAVTQGYFSPPETVISEIKNFALAHGWLNPDFGAGHWCCRTIFDIRLLVVEVHRFNQNLSGCNPRVEALRLAQVALHLQAEFEGAVDFAEQNL